MSILYLLIPLSLLLLGAAVAVFFWAVRSGQFDDLEGPAHRILFDDDEADLMAAQRQRQDDAVNGDTDPDEGRAAPTGNGNRARRDTDTDTDTNTDHDMTSR